jgi:hypothetical protein
MKIHPSSIYRKKGDTPENVPPKAGVSQNFPPMC